MKCANCEQPAFFEYKLTDKKSLFYCGKHLPKFLDSRKRADLLPVTESFTETKAEAIDILIAPTPVEEPVVEEPIALKPKKKATKKKAE